MIIKGKTNAEGVARSRGGILGVTLPVVSRDGGIRAKNPCAIGIRGVPPRLGFGGTGVSGVISRKESRKPGRKGVRCRCHRHLPRPREVGRFWTGVRFRSGPADALAQEGVDERNE